MVLSSNIETREELEQAPAKMSKSLKNVVNPDDVVEQYGADTLRVYEMFMGPLDTSITWSEEGLEGSRKFLDRVYRLLNEVFLCHHLGNRTTFIKIGRAHV